MPLKIGDTLPRFKGVTTEGPITHKDLIGSRSVIYFYPKDSTPGCTTEACDFRDNAAAFKKLKTKVYGVSKDSLKSHAKFAEKLELPFPLISDEDGSICEAFGVWAEKTLYGRKYMGITRATFLFDKEGVLRQMWPQVKVTGHINEVLDAVRKIK